MAKTKVVCFTQIQVQIQFKLYGKKIERVRCFKYLGIRPEDSAVLLLKQPQCFMDMNEMPLEIRRNQISLTYWANLKGHKKSPQLRRCDRCVKGRKEDR